MSEKREKQPRKKAAKRIEIDETDKLPRLVNSDGNGAILPNVFDEIDLAETVIISRSDFELYQIGLVIACFFICAFAGYGMKAFYQRYGTFI